MLSRVFVAFSAAILPGKLSKMTALGCSDTHQPFQGSALFRPGLVRPLCDRLCHDASWCSSATFQTQAHRPIPLLIRSFGTVSGVLSQTRELRPATRGCEEIVIICSVTNPAQAKRYRLDSRADARPCKPCRRATSSKGIPVSLIDLFRKM